MKIQNTPIWSTDLSPGAKILWAVKRYKNVQLSGHARALSDLLEEHSSRAAEVSVYASELRSAGWLERRGGKSVAVVPQASQVREDAP